MRTIYNTRQSQPMLAQKNKLLGSAEMIWLVLARPSDQRKPCKSTDVDRDSLVRQPPL